MRLRTPPRPARRLEGKLAVSMVLLVLVGSCKGNPGGEGGSAWVPILRFDRETVILRITPGEVEVEGTYEFLHAGGGPDSVSLFYPYPRDSLLGPAETALVERRCQGARAEPIRFVEHAPAGVSWSVPLRGCRRITIHTLYRQRLETTYARYIVTTTAAWGRPLSRARFEIHLPAGATPEGFSFPFQQDERTGAGAWTYEARDFMPADDVVVRWRYGGRPGGSGSGS